MQLLSLVLTLICSITAGETQAQQSYQPLQDVANLYQCWTNQALLLSASLGTGSQTYWKNMQSWLAKPDVY